MTEVSVFSSTSLVMFCRHDDLISKGSGALKVSINKFGLDRKTDYESAEHKEAIFKLGQYWSIRTELDDQASSVNSISRSRFPRACWGAHVVVQTEMCSRLDKVLEMRRKPESRAMGLLIHTESESQTHGAATERSTTTWSYIWSKEARPCGMQ